MHIVGVQIPDSFNSSNGVCMEDHIGFRVQGLGKFTGFTYNNYSWY